MAETRPAIGERNVCGRRIYHLAAVPVSDKGAYPGSRNSFPRAGAAVQCASSRTSVASQDAHSNLRSLRCGPVWTTLTSHIGSPQEGQRGRSVTNTIEVKTKSVRGTASSRSGADGARRARGAGYCTFNGLVLAARAALDAGARTVLILDLDAHCGGGTHELIHGDERIWHMDISVSAFDRYEPLGNNQLEMVYDGSRYLQTIERKLTWLEREAPRFDICLYNAGMDPFEGCSTGGMQGITQKVLRDREVAVFSWCRMRGVPVAFVLAGDTSGRGLIARGLSRSTGSLSKRRAHARNAPWLALTDWKPSTKRLGVPYSASTERHHNRGGRSRQPRKALPDRVGNIVRREKCIVLLGHAGVGVTELAARPQTCAAGGEGSFTNGAGHGWCRKFLPTFCLISVGKPPRTSSDKFNAKARKI